MIQDHRLHTGAALYPAASMYWRCTASALEQLPSHFTRRVKDRMYVGLVISDGTTAFGSVAPLVNWGSYTVEVREPGATEPLFTPVRISIS